MRDIFFRYLTNTEHDFVFSTNDVGRPWVHQFEEAAHFINFGISEPHMIAAASGIAAEGLPCIVYGITPFISLRCLESISNNLKTGTRVLIAGAGSGFAYGGFGSTHFATHDLRALDGLPGLKLYTPGTQYEVRSCLDDFFSGTHPAFIRLTDGADITALQGHQGFSIISEGSKATVISHSSTVEYLKGLLREDIQLISCFDMNFCPKQLRGLISGQKVYIVEEVFGGGPLAQRLIVQEDLTATYFSYKPAEISGNFSEYQLRKKFGLANFLEQHQLTTGP